MEKRYWFVFCCESLVLTKDEDGNYAIPLGKTPPTETKEWTVMQELPELNGIPCTAYSINTPINDNGTLCTIGLRESYNVLPFSHYNMAGKAAQLLYWDSCTKYCGVCGAPMKRNSIISKKCTNCGKEVWPQIAPAIIVRINRNDSPDKTPEEDQILLVHAKNFRRSGMYGLVAGFVETGETLEECVEREVMEETGLKINNIKYFGSQSWPYPSGVMIGYTADYVSGEIKLQEEELSRGGWFKRGNLPQIPDKLSIARKLIDDWIGEE
ncbi:MAG: NAD(+) diphosphatase [Bacteroidaceae bacterium]|nr:NAD(+) diphosphatase [Bacteroidaceae bacterium]